ncbi:Aspartate-semialdehyde dehydrogenase [Linum perenne]
MKNRLSCKMLLMVVSTYQAASGVGAAAMEELELQTREVCFFITSPCGMECLQSMLNLSHNAPVQPNGYNEEEMKLVKETRRIWIVDESSETDRRSFTGEEYNTNTPSPQKSAPEQNW